MQQKINMEHYNQLFLTIIKSTNAESLQPTWPEGQNWPMDHLNPSSSVHKQDLTKYINKYMNQ